MLEVKTPPPSADAQETTPLPQPPTATPSVPAQTSQTPTTPNPQPKVDKKRLILVGIILLIVVLMIASVLGLLKYRNDHQKAAAPTVVSTAAQASITPSGFAPGTITVKVGQAVVWTNFDSTGHDIVSTPNAKNGTLDGFNSPDLIQNQTYSFVFDKAGTYTYHDSTNPTVFSGTVIVK